MDERQCQELQELAENNEKLIHNIRYADDAGLLVTSQEDVQRLVNKIKGKINGLTINKQTKKRPKFMIISRERHQIVTINGKKLD